MEDLRNKRNEDFCEFVSKKSSPTNSSSSKLIELDVSLNATLSLDNVDLDNTFLADDIHLQEKVKKKPNFDRVYEEFEIMKKRNKATMEEASCSQHIATLQSLQASVANREELPVGGSLVGAMNNFMAAHTFRNPVQKPRSSMPDWSKEALGLLEEFQRLNTTLQRPNKAWSVKKRAESEDSGFHSELAYSRHQSYSENDSTRSSLFTTPNGSTPNSDDELSLDLFSSETVDKSVLPPIGQPQRRISQQSMDSGYQSTDHSGQWLKHQGSQLSQLADTEDLSITPNNQSFPVFNYEPISPIKRDPYHETTIPGYNWMCVSCPSHPHVNMMSLSGSGINASASSDASLRNSVDNGCGGQQQRHKKWITEEILEMIAVRDKLYKRMKKYPSPDIVAMYKKIRNMVVGMTRNAKRAYEKREEQNQGYSRNIRTYNRRSFERSR